MVFILILVFSPAANADRLAGPICDTSIEGILKRVADSEIVFKGYTLHTELYAEERSDNGIVWDTLHKSEFIVLESFKNARKLENRTVWHNQGRFDGFYETPVAGQTYLVFATEIENGSLKADEYQWHCPLSEAELRDALYGFELD